MLLKKGGGGVSHSCAPLIPPGWFFFFPSLDWCAALVGERLEELWEELKVQQVERDYYRNLFFGGDYRDAGNLSRQVSGYLVCGHLLLLLL